MLPANIQVNKYLLRFIECWLQFLDCMAEDKKKKKDKFESIPYLQGGRMRDSIDKERGLGSHVSSVVDLLGGPRQITLSVCGSVFSFTD